MAAVGMVCAAALVLSACGSDDENSGGGGGGGGGGGNRGTLDVGMLTSLSGPVSQAAAGAIRGAQARFDAYKDSDGACADTTFNLVQGDDASSAQGALAGAQKLVQQDNVYAMLEVSPFFYGATPFLTTAGSGTPVFGGAFDGAQEWNNTDDNMFNTSQVPNYDVANSGIGDFFKQQGATKVGGIAYVSPSSQAALDQSFQSLEAAGLQTGYKNNTVQFGSTDVGPLVLGIVQDGDDGVYAPINFDTTLALAAGLRQAGWQGTLLSATGYGADLLGSEPAIQAGQGVIFSNAFTPVELNTDATNQLKEALQAAGNESGIPGYYESQGWFTADLFLYGLEKAGCDASQADLISTLQSTDDWDAGGLYPQPIPQSTTDYDQVCSYYVQLEGNAFTPLFDGQPVCGDPLS